MAFVTVEDMYGTTEVIIFEKGYFYEPESISSD